MSQNTLIILLLIAVTIGNINNLLDFVDWRQRRRQKAHVA
jgi:hypothetical protein